MGASLHICQGCIDLLAIQEGRGGEAEARVGALLRSLETQLGPLRVQRDECLLHCGEGSVCMLLRKDGELRSKMAHLDPLSPQDPRWLRR